MKEVKVLVTPSGLTLQARILEWIAIPFFGDLPDPGIGPRSPMLQADSLPSAPPGMLNREVSFTKCFLLPSSVTSQITFYSFSPDTQLYLQNVQQKNPRLLILLQIWGTKKQVQYLQLLSISFPIYQQLPIHLSFSLIKGIQQEMGSK